jgi:hypothetical protein
LRSESDEGGDNGCGGDCRDAASCQAKVGGLPGLTARDEVSRPTGGDVSDRESITVKFSTAKFMLAQMFSLNPSASPGTLVLGAEFLLSQRGNKVESWKELE